MSPALGLGIVNLVWGSTFFLTKGTLETIAREAGLPAHADAVWIAFLAVRFALAAGAICLVLPGSLRSLRDGALWRDALWIAAPTSLGFALQSAGLSRVTPADSAFLTSLYVPFTPLLGWLLFRTRMPGALLPALVLAVAGLWILTAPASPEFGTGGLLSAACGPAFALQILFIARWGARRDPGALTAAMLAWMALIFGALALTVPDGRAAMEAAFTPGAKWPLLFLGTVGTLYPFWAMNRFQPLLDPARAALIYALEPVFAAAFSALCFGERFGAAELAGGSLVVLANAWAGRAALNPAPGADIIPRP